MLFRLQIVDCWNWAVSWFLLRRDCVQLTVVNICVSRIIDVALPNRALTVNDPYSFLCKVRKAKLDGLVVQLAVMIWIWYRGVYKRSCSFLVVNPTSKACWTTMEIQGILGNLIMNLNWTELVVSWRALARTVSIRLCILQFQILMIVGWILRIVVLRSVSKDILLKLGVGGHSLRERVRHLRRRMRILLVERLLLLLLVERLLLF